MIYVSPYQQKYNCWLYKGAITNIFILTVESSRYCVRIEIFMLLSKHKDSFHSFNQLTKNAANSCICQEV